MAALASTDFGLAGAATGAGAAAEAQLAGLQGQLAAEAAKSQQATVQVAALQQQLAQAQADAATARATAATAQADSGANAELESQVQRLTAANRDLETSASANMKRIQKLMRDIEEARAGQQGGGSASAETAALKADLARLQVDLAQVQMEKTDLQQRLRAAESTTGAGSTGGPSPEVQKVISELNGIVSMFRNDFMQVADAFEQVRSDDAGERDEGFELMREGIENCQTRSGELKDVIRNLKSTLGEG